MVAKVKVLALLMSCFAAAAVAGWDSEKMTRELEAGAGETLSLRNVNGGIEITGWDQSYVEMIALKEAKSGRGYSAKEKLNRLEIKIEQTQDGWDIRTIIDRSWKNSNRMNNTRVSYTLKVPQGMLLDIETTNGKINLDSFDGEVQLESTNGSLTANNVRGNFKGETTNGSIRLELLAFDGGSLNCRTTNGNVTISVPGDIQADLSARTTNGSIKTDIPMKISGSMSRRKVNGTLNGGGARIDLRTTNGSIRISEI